MIKIDLFQTAVFVQLSAGVRGSALVVVPLRKRQWLRRVRQMNRIADVILFIPRA